MSQYRQAGVICKDIKCQNKTLGAKIRHVV
jgi:hypothetical protein